MIRINRITAIIIGLALSAGIYAQVKVTVDYNVQKYIGEVSELERDKYVNLHTGTSTDSDINKFKSDYNVNGGRGFWAAFSYAKSQTGEVGKYPPARGDNNTAVRTVKRHVATEHPGSVFEDGLDVAKAAEWAVEYYKNYVSDGDLPEFFEPMNEPFVHAGEFGSDKTSIIRQMSELFGAVGEAIHNAPELANMKVIGYSSAWPSLELWDFRHWESYQKMFMDVAGEHMDAFATHLYDGVNVTGQNNYRSGSNAEAILDLIETYSYVKWGVVKPHAISEYGGIVEGYSGDWDAVASSNGNIGQNHLMMGLMNREDRMLISIPFTTDKSTWHINAGNNCQPYGPAILIPENLGSCNASGWEYTPRLLFYEIWKDIKGQRVSINSENPDIQTQAFVDGNKLYIVLDNIDSKQHVVNLNYTASMGEVTNVRTKSLKTPAQDMPEYDDTESTDVPSAITLESDEIVALEYTFSSDISFGNTLRSKNYYNTKHLVEIDGPSSFTFDNIDLGSGSGSARIRLSIGRDINLDVLPLLVKLNGENIDVPTNWIGYDQAGREDFFGMIEIPVPFHMVQESNTIDVIYADKGGKISSVIFQTELYDSDYVGVNDVKQQASSVTIYPTKVQGGEFNVLFEANHSYQTLSVISIDGRLVYTQNVNNSDQSMIVNTASMAKGVYMVSLEGENYRDTQRIIIE